MCISGRASRDIIRDLEESFVDAQKTRTEVLRTFRRSGLKVEAEHVIVRKNSLLVDYRHLPEEERSYARRICEAYANEVEILYPNDRK
jgi:uncharacterized protein YacL (UPF0231 family)